MKVKNLKRKTHSKKGVQNREPIYVEVTIEHKIFIDSLIETCTLPLKEVDKIRTDLESMTEGEAEELTEYLKENQRHAMKDGFNYSQTDLSYELAKIQKEK
jgi:hypothetical protein